MFAVPGWKLAAKSLVQEQAKPVKERSQKSPTGVTVTDSKKRKRDQASQSKGPDSNSKPPNTSSNGRVTPLTDEKRKPAQHESQLNGSQHTKKRPAKQSRKGRDNSKITGANAEPVRSIGVRRNSEKQEKQEPHGVKDTPVPREVLQAPKHERRRKSSNEIKRLPAAQTAGDEAENAALQSLPPIPPASTTLTPLQAKMRAKLTSARFRHLNETLYTTSSSDALSLFTSSPDLFAEYHAGFSQQVRDSWPRNPVDVYITHIRTRAGLSAPVNDTAILPRRRPGTCTIADLGCGDAPLARALQPVIKKLNLILHNFDLHAPNSLVTKADISALPLRDGEVDVAIFCLSLMGTNWLAFVEEAWRVLRGDGKGEVWVAEVKSRFGRISARKGAARVVENSVGKRRKVQAGSKSQFGDDADDEKLVVVDEREAEKPGADDDTDLQPFIDSFQRRGLMLKDGSVDKSNKMFVSMIFTKTGLPRVGKWKNMKWNGKEYQPMQERPRSQQNKFHAGREKLADEEMDEHEESKLLKPCVYKLST